MEKLDSCLRANLKATLFSVSRRTGEFIETKDGLAVLKKYPEIQIRMLRMILGTGIPFSTKNFRVDLT